MNSPPLQPPPPPPSPQLVQDAEHLKLLAVFHYVVAGLSFLFSCFPIFHVIMGFMLISGKFPSGGSPGSGFPPEMGWFLVCFGSTVILLGWVFSVLIFFAGKSISERRRWMFVFVIACLQCASFPIGTTLGVFTIIVLQRPTVKGLFERPETPAVGVV